MFNISFDAVEQAFDAADAALSVAESHGCLTGALCVYEAYSVDQWLEEVLSDAAPTAAAAQAETVRGSMQVLFADTVRALRSGDMEFAPLLPDDETSLAARTDALAEWSQGFLYGFGIGRAAQTPESLQAVEEVLRDLTEIARASSNELTGSEEEEQAYSELVEYVRAAAQLIYDELFEQRKHQIH